MNETLEQKRRRLYGRQKFPQYLSLIQKITTGIEINNIKSIVETDNVIEKTSFLSLTKSFKIDFNDKKELKNIICEMNIYHGSFYLFSSYAQDCGVLEIPSIENFNFNFNFSDEPSGIITLVSSDLKRKYLLDFYEENNNQILDIEIYE